MGVLRTWLPAASGMVFLGLGAGLIGIYGFFVEPLSKEFGVGVAVLNIGPVALLLVPGLVSPFVGRLVDRVPIRRIVLVGSTVAMGALLAISRAPSVAWAGAGFLLFSLGLVMYGPVVVNGLMVKLYPGREARALAVAAIGISVATAVLPPVMGLLLGAFDWRAALSMLACALLLILWGAALVGVPPGMAGTAVEAQAKAGREFYREGTFWLIGVCMALGLNVSVILAICYPPHFIAAGYTPVEAGWFLSLAGISGLVGKVTVAWLGDHLRRHAKWLVVAVLMIEVFGFTLLLGAASIDDVYVAMIVMGFSGGAFLPMHGYINSRYFDAAVIGQVTGAQMPLFLPLGLVGAPLAGYVFDRTGSYDLVLVGLAAIACVAAALAVRLPAPTR